jgi:hypothetical protein
MTCTIERMLRAIALILLTTACSGGGPQGETAAGSPSAHGVPDWVPIYPGARVSGGETRNAGVETYTTFQLDSTADCEKVHAWYDEKLKVSGFNVVGNAGQLQGNCSSIMRADGPGNTRGVNMNGSGGSGGPSRFAFQAVVRQLPGSGGVGAAASIPAWVPQYPGSKPANVVTKQEGPERSADFSFTTADDAKIVIAWYERTLKDARFTIVASTVFDGSTAKLTAQDATGRSILNIRMEPAGGQKVVAIQAREGVQ